MDIINHLRQTGRTTRMLQAAGEQVKQKKAVTIIFATFLEYECHRPNYNFLLSEYTNVKIFDPKEKGGIQKFFALDPETTFIDHAVIEKHFPDLVSALNRFNLKPETHPEYYCKDSIKGD